MPNLDRLAEERRLTESTLSTSYPMHLVKAHETWLCGNEPCNTTEHTLPVATARWEANCNPEVRHTFLYSGSRIPCAFTSVTIIALSVEKMYVRTRMQAALIKVQSIRAVGPSFDLP